jgi:hypothetical protein
VIYKCFGHFCKAEEDCYKYIRAREIIAKKEEDVKLFKIKGFKDINTVFLS